MAWGEMDAFGHVNNITYFRYFESARIACFEKLGFLKMMEETGVGPILASTQCRFKLPLAYPDTVFAGTRITNPEEDRFLMEYIVVSRRHRQTAAIGDGLIVCFDYRQNRKTALPEEIRRGIQELEASVKRG